MLEWRFPASALETDLQEHCQVPGLMTGHGVCTRSSLFQICLLSTPVFHYNPPLLELDQCSPAVSGSSVTGSDYKFAHGDDVFPGAGLESLNRSECSSRGGCNPYKTG